METSHAPPVLTLSQAADFLQISVRTLWYLTKTGQVPSFRTGRQHRYHRETLEQWCRERSTEQTIQPKGDE